MRCTIQRCHNRAKGRLAALVQDRDSVRSVWSLHSLDVEWLVTNFLISTGICTAVWGGGRSFPTIDHAGFNAHGREVLAQTTVSRLLVVQKAAKLLELGSASRELLFFGPEECTSLCPANIRYYSIEHVFRTLDQTPSGKWLIDLMLRDPRSPVARPSANRLSVEPK